MEVESREINVRTKRSLKVGVKQKWFKRVVARVLEAEGVTGPVELGLVITDMETIKYLNKTYRHRDEPTDVLAFNIVSHDACEENQDFAIPPDGMTHLGEVVISYPVAVQQAQEHGHSVEQELALLTVHGVLHLLGYDHEDVKGRRRMRAKEKRILGILGYGN